MARKASRTRVASPSPERTAHKQPSSNSKSRTQSAERRIKKLDEISKQLEKVVPPAGETSKRGSRKTKKAVRGRKSSSSPKRGPAEDDEEVDEESDITTTTITTTTATTTTSRSRKTSPTRSGKRSKTGSARTSPVAVSKRGKTTPEYLNEGFDLSKLRVTDLKEILATHDIDISTRKRVLKADLIEIVENEIVIPSRALDQGVVEPTSVEEEDHVESYVARSAQPQQVEQEPHQQQASSVISPGSMIMNAVSGLFTRRSPVEPSRATADVSTVNSDKQNNPFLESASVDNSPTTVGARKGRSSPPKNSFAEKLTKHTNHHDYNGSDADYESDDGDESNESQTMETLEERTFISEPNTPATAKSPFNARRTPGSMGSKKSVYFDNGTPRSLADEGRGSPLRRRADITSSEGSSPEGSTHGGFTIRGNPGRTPGPGKKVRYIENGSTPSRGYTVNEETTTRKEKKTFIENFVEYVKNSTKSIMNSPVGLPTPSKTGSDASTPALDERADSGFGNDQQSPSETTHRGRGRSKITSTDKGRSQDRNQSIGQSSDSESLSTSSSPSRVITPHRGIPTQQSSWESPTSFARFKQILGTPLKFADGIRLWRQALPIEQQSGKGLEEVANSKKPRRFFLSDLFLFMFVAFLIVLGLYSDWYIKNNADLGYCRSEDDPRARINYHGWNPVGYYLPRCVECPAKSVCSKRSVVRCLDSSSSLEYPLYMTFIDRKYIPFPFDTPSCVSSRRYHQQSRRRLTHVKNLLQLIDDDVRDFVGKAECGYINKEHLRNVMSLVDHRVVGKVQNLVERDLKKSVKDNYLSDFDSLWNEAMKRIIFQQQGKYLDGEEFPEYSQNIIHETPITTNNRGYNVSYAENRRRRAIGHIPVTSVVSEDGAIRILRSENPPKYTYACVIKKSLLQFAMMYYHILSFFLISLVLIYVFVLRRRAMAREIEILRHLENDIHMQLFVAKTKYRESRSQLLTPGIPVQDLKNKFLPTMYPINESPVRGDHERFVVDGYLSVWFLDPVQRERIWRKLETKVRNTRKDIDEVDLDGAKCWELNVSAHMAPRARTGVSPGRMPEVDAPN